MKHSETTDTFWSDYRKYYELGKKSSKNAQNPYFNSEYASLSEVMKTSRRELLKVGIMVVQFVDGDRLVTRLQHDCGEYIQDEGVMLVHQPNNAQSLGGSITYARRYGLKTILGMLDVDGDGETAVNRERKETKAEKEIKVTPENDVMEAMRQRISVGKEKAECPNCGGEMAVSKEGKLYCKSLCWLKK